MRKVKTLKVFFFLISGWFLLLHCQPLLPALRLVSSWLCLLAPELSKLTCVTYWCCEPNSNGPWAIMVRNLNQPTDENPGVSLSGGWPCRKRARWFIRILRHTSRAAKGVSAIPLPKQRHAQSTVGVSCSPLCLSPVKAKAWPTPT